MHRLRPRSRPNSRRGIVVVLAAAFVVVLFAFAALSIDAGYILLTKSELQNGADAAAIAAAQKLREERRAGTGGMAEEVAEEVRAVAALLAGENPAGNLSPELDTEQDVRIGVLAADGEVVPVGDARTANAVSVRVRRDRKVNGPLTLFFGPLIGVPNAELTATATAVLQSDVRGFRPRPGQPSTLIPFAVHADVWDAVLRGEGRDRFAWDTDAEFIDSGSDGIVEFDVFTSEQHASGNFGTLRIGRRNNNMPGIVRQIRSGVGHQDLRGAQGVLKLDESTGRVEIAGDPGGGGPIYAAAASIIGKPISIAVFDDVSGNGGQAVYSVKAFVGARIVAVDGGGRKAIRMQPAMVHDPTAEFGDGTGESRYVYGSIKLVK